MPDNDSWFSLHSDRLTMRMPGGGSIAVPFDSLANTRLANPESAASRALQRAGTRILGLMRDYEPQPKIQRQFLHHDRPDVISNLRNLYTATARLHKEAEDTVASWLKVENLSDLRAATILSTLQGQKQAELVKRAHADATVAAVVLDPVFYAALGLDEASRPQLERSIAHANLTRLHLASPSARRPSLSDPMAEKPDAQYAARMADIQMAGVDTMRAEVSAGLQWIGAATAFVAGMSEDTPAAVFDAVAAAA
ncbi:hypothetical protein [Aquamicrobium defluvii]|uniref:Uncharacterized protein n=1 Tax=Aquamicrobium defluvii TaxID=69279 RepID=A0A011ULA2_9HYPH|nr:hypothetical protein [Aquamicrobium defluvii]EXL06688.1 hypothetical protein BG36_06380 [Aquamicrobium defluvii]EZQ14510.1 hypothetical protein CF98_19930 [Halopseudomonas bauzanensis]TDR30328.1 hypothetical protein DES43_14620 [Aquamicrobium defluvii]